MKKPTKKELRLAHQKAELRQRIRDIAVGSAGYNFEGDGEIATAEFLERFVCAMKITFGNDSNKYMWEPHCLAHFNDIDSTTDFVWSHRNTFK